MQTHRGKSRLFYCQASGRDRQTDTETDRQTDRDRQTDTQTNTDTETEKRQDYFIVKLVKQTDRKTMRHTN